MGPREVILSGVVPGFIVGLMLVLSWWIAAVTGVRRPQREARGGVIRVAVSGPDGTGPLWAGAVAFGAAILVAMFAFDRPPTSFWPTSGDDRIWLGAAAVALVGVILGVVSSLVKVPKLVNALAFGTVTGAGAWALFEPLAAEYVGLGGAAIWGPVTGLVVAGQVYVAEVSAPRFRGWRFPLVLLPIAGLIVPTHFWSGFAGAALMSNGLVAVVSAAALAGVLAPRINLGGGALGVFLSQHALLIVLNRGYSYEPGMSLVQFCVLLAAPLGIAVLLIPALWKWPAWRGVVIGGVLCAVLAVVGAAFEAPFAGGDAEDGAADENPYAEYQ